MSDPINGFKCPWGMWRRGIIPQHVVPVRNYAFFSDNVFASPKFFTVIFFNQQNDEVLIVCSKHWISLIFLSDNWWMTEMGEFSNHISFWIVSEGKFFGLFWEIWITPFYPQGSFSVASGFPYAATNAFPSVCLFTNSPANPSRHHFRHIWFFRWTPPKKK